MHNHPVVEASRISHYVPTTAQLSDAIVFAETNHIACSLDPIEVDDGTTAYACVTAVRDREPGDESVDVSYGVDAMTAYVTHMRSLAAVLALLNKAGVRS